MNRLGSCSRRLTPVIHPGWVLSITKRKVEIWPEVDGSAPIRQPVLSEVGQDWAKVLENPDTSPTNAVVTKSLIHRFCSLMRECSIRINEKYYSKWVYSQGQILPLLDIKWWRFEMTKNKKVMWYVRNMGRGKFSGLSGKGKVIRWKL